MPALTRRVDPGRCPDCRERVTPFAAGCALCGADLDPRRWDGGPSVTQRAGSLTAALRFGPSKGRPRSGSSPEWVGVVFSCAAFGLLLTLVGGLLAAILMAAGAL